MSKNTIYRIFQSRCYDENEEDPWTFMPTLSKDNLPADPEVGIISYAQALTSWK